MCHQQQIDKSKLFPEFRVNTQGYEAGSEIDKDVGDMVTFNGGRWLERCCLPRGRKPVESFPLATVSMSPTMYKLLRITLLTFGLVFVAAAETPWNLQKHTIEAPGIRASYIAYGARLTNLLVPDKNGVFRDVVLGYDKGYQYINDTENEHTYFGATSK